MDIDIDLDKVWDDAWNKELDDIKFYSGKDFNINELRQSSRTTKANPDGENAEWWYANGRKYLDSWIAWRKGTNWNIWTTPNGDPAIELEFLIETGGITLKGAVDRVFITEGYDKPEMIIVDLKTGMRTPQSDLQLQVYACMMEKTFGIRPEWGTYWMARQGSTSTPIRLDKFTLQKLDEMVSLFQKARENNIYLPNFDSCKLCSVTEYCYWVDGQDATKLGEISGNK